MRNYWVYRRKKRKIEGPLEIEDLKKLDITPNDLAWFSELDNWEPAGSLPELKILFHHEKSRRGKKEKRLTPPPLPFGDKKELLRLSSSLRIINILSIIGIFISLGILILGDQVFHQECGCISSSGILTHYQKPPFFRENSFFIILFGLFFLAFSIYNIVKIAKRKKLLLLVRDSENTVITNEATAMELQEKKETADIEYH